MDSERNRQSHIEEAPLNTCIHAFDCALVKSASSWWNQRVGLLTAVHFITGVLAVDHLVTAAEVGDATAVFALELSWFAQGH